jgi:hypothetical protein
MGVSVILEHVDDEGFRATALVPTPLVAEAPTRDEAVQKIRALVEQRLARAELIQIDVPGAAKDNPWLAIAGTWRDHPGLDEVEENMRARVPLSRRDNRK